MYLDLLERRLDKYFNAKGPFFGVLLVQLAHLSERVPGPLRLFNVVKFADDVAVGGDHSPCEALLHLGWELFNFVIVSFSILVFSFLCVCESLENNDDQLTIIDILILSFSTSSSSYSTSSST